MKELTDDDCRDIEFKVSQEAPTDPPPNIIQLRRLAMKVAYTKGYQSCLKELAEKCGEKPCLTCSRWDSAKDECLAMPEDDCGSYPIWEAQQQGYAKAINESINRGGAPQD